MLKFGAQFNIWRLDIELIGKVKKAGGKVKIKN